MTEIQKIERDASLPRVETGPVQFGDDWPGVFFRGDNAFEFALLLGLELNGQGDAITKAQLRGFLSDLRSCILK